jgi:hypothetical protein
MSAAVTANDRSKSFGLAQTPLGQPLLDISIPCSDWHGSDLQKSSRDLRVHFAVEMLCVI